MAEVHLEEALEEQVGEWVGTGNCGFGLFIDDALGEFHYFQEHDLASLSKSRVFTTRKTALWLLSGRKRANRNSIDFAVDLG